MRYYNMSIAPKAPDFTPQETKIATEAHNLAPLDFNPKPMMSELHQIGIYEFDYSELDSKIQAVFSHYQNNSIGCMIMLHNIAMTYYKDEREQVIKTALDNKLSIVDIQDDIEECYRFAKYCCKMALFLKNMDLTQKRSYNEIKAKISKTLLEIEIAHSRFQKRKSLDLAVIEVLHHHQDNIVECMRNLYNIANTYYKDDIDELLTASLPDADLTKIQEDMEQCYQFSKYCCLVALGLKSTNPDEQPSFKKVRKKISRLLAKIEDPNLISRIQANIIRAHPPSVMSDSVANVQARLIALAVAPPSLTSVEGKQDETPITTLGTAPDPMLFSLDAVQAHSSASSGFSFSSPPMVTSPLTSPFISPGGLELHEIQVTDTPSTPALLRSLPHILVKLRKTK